MKRSLKHLLRAGFSLIEVNMAIFVLAGGALALLGLFPLGLRESLEARHEMRVAAFAERFVSAARAAAENAKDANDLADILEGEFGFRLKRGQFNDEGGGTISATEDRNTGVWYRAWFIPENDLLQNTNDHELIQVGVQVTAEDCSQNNRALVRAPVYVVRTFVDRKNARQ